MTCDLSPVLKSSHLYERTRVVTSIKERAGGVASDVVDQWHYYCGSDFHQARQLLWKWWWRSWPWKWRWPLKWPSSWPSRWSLEKVKHCTQGKDEQLDESMETIDWEDRLE